MKHSFRLAISHPPYRQPTAQKMSATERALAVDDGTQNLTRDIDRILTGEKERGWCDLVRLPRSSHRYVLAKILQLLGTGTATGIERRPDRARRNGVHPNAAE